MILTVQRHGKRLGIFIAAYFAFHGRLPLKDKCSRATSNSRAKKMPDWTIVISGACVESLAHGLHSLTLILNGSPSKPAGVLIMNVMRTRKDKPSWEQFCSSS